MYKNAQRFQDYMGRSNRFIDRILAGGNRLETDLIAAETDTELLMDTFGRLKETRVDRYNVMMQLRAEKADLNRATRGLPDHMLRDDTATLRHRLVQRYRDALNSLQHLDWHLDLIRARLSSLGVVLNEEAQFGVRAMVHDEAKNARRQEKRRKVPRVRAKRRKNLARTWLP